jgi:predicted small lipoprotein YifL
MKKAVTWVLLVVLTGLAACSPKTPPLLPPLTPSPPIASNQTPHSYRESHLSNLSGADKEKALQIALNISEVKDRINSGAFYTTDLNWVALQKNVSGGWDIYSFDYGVLEIPKNVPPSATIYPYVSIALGQPPTLLVRVAVDLSTGEAVNVDTHPLKLLP